MPLYTSDGFDVDRSIGYLAKRATQLGGIALDPVFAHHGLTHSQWSAMMNIDVGRARTCAELARETSYDKGATTRLIDALERKGWVVRERDPIDRRVINLVLTSQGRAVVREVRDAIVACWDDWLGDWQPADVDTLMLLLQRLVDVLGQAAKDGGCA